MMTKQDHNTHHSQHDKQHLHGGGEEARTSNLQRCGFDEPTPPEGWAALRMFIPRPPLK